MNTKPSLGTGFAGVCAHAVAAGIIASRRGSARVARALFRNVRLGIAFFVKNIALSLLVGQAFSLPPGFSRRFHCLFSAPHLKRNTLHDSENERREPIILLLRLIHDLANGGRVRVLDASSQRERQKVL